MERTQEYLATIEEALVRHPAFGDSAYIVSQLDVTFLRRMAIVGETLSSARDLVAACEAADLETRRRIAGNTVIRCAAYHAHTQITSDQICALSVETCDAIFAATAAHLRAGKPGTPFENGATALDRLDDDPAHGWIWREEYPSDLFGEAFRQILQFEYGSELVSTTPDERTMLRLASQLLSDLLPDLAHGALGHAHLIACFPDTGFWKGKLSSSQIRMGGTVFLSRHLLRNPWCTAEHLLHESLHQKFYDFRHGHSLLVPDVPAEEVRKVCALWNGRELIDANQWDVHRAFAAFHVYVQLALLAQVAERRAAELEPVYGPFQGMVSSRTALDRAWHLGESIGTICSHQIGPAGARMREWLMAVLDELDPAPPPSGAKVHFLLDLYEREANRVEQVLRTAPAGNAPLLRELGSAAEEERAHARALLQDIGADAELRELDSAFDRLDPEQSNLFFPAVRRLIARAVKASSPGGYRLRTVPGGPDDPDALLQRLVDAGSERLQLIQSNLPKPVAAAMRRARDHMFNKSSDDQVGRLLAVLAAAIRPGGRILEIGTGVGVGLAWMTGGLSTRSDVAVVSIEGDQRLSAAARAWPWPPYVEIITDDAIEILPGLGTFDLVFADAAPVKYGDRDRLIATLRPGGILVIDDLSDRAGGTPAQFAQRAELRSALLHHPELQALELDWATHVVLATRLPGKAHEAPAAAAKAAHPAEEDRDLARV